MAAKPNKSSPRAMPVETIITRFKSAQQRRQLREMDRSMSKITELLKNPVKPKAKNPKTQAKKVKSHTKKDKAKICAETLDVTDEEYYPMKLKRQIVLNKVQLRPKHDLKIIAQTNKRKRSIPQKGIFTDEDQCQDTLSSRDSSPGSKRLKQVSDMSMSEMVQLIEDSGSLNDEDLLEILTCPSPVWWEDPPNGYIEDALFTRPRSTAEMYPSVRTQIQDNLERKRSNTPNVLSRRERNKLVLKHKSDVSVLKHKSDVSTSVVGISLRDSDETFREKRSKLESVLGNLRSKNSDVTVDVGKSGSEFNKVSVIKNLASEVKGRIDSEGVAVDEEHLMDISHDDDCLSVLENMDIPTKATDVATDKEMGVEKKNSTDVQGNSVTAIPVEETGEIATDTPIDNVATVEEAGGISDVIKQVESNRTEPTPETGASDKTPYNPIFEDISDTSNDSVDGYRNCPNIYPNSYVTAQSGGYNRPMDLAYGKKSSIIEDYLEMQLVEDEETIIHKKQNEYSKNEFISPILCDPKYDVETDLSRSVIKFRNSDSNSIHIVKVEPRDSIVPRELPPLRNSDRLKGSGCVTDNLPPLRRNPGVIITNESVKNKTIPFDTIESLNKALIQEKSDSISDTNVCFLNENDADASRADKQNPTVIKSSQSNLNGGKSGASFPNDLGFKSQLNFPVSALNFTQNIDMCKDFDFIQNPEVYGNQYNDLDIQSLTITKLSDNTSKPKEKRTFTTNQHNVSKTYCNRKKCTKAKPNKPVPPKVVPTDVNRMQNKPINNFNENAKGITVFQIVPDITINEKITPTTAAKEFKLPQNPVAQNSEKADGNLLLYFKKCKNVYWQKNDKIPAPVDKNGAINGKRDKQGNNNVKILNSVNITNTNSNFIKPTITQNDNKLETDITLNKDSSKEKCILVSNSTQIKYCMKCSSIFDTTQCNYCSRQNGIDNKNQCTTDYILKMEQRFVCDVCRYKALSKDSLERHISSCKSKNR